MKPATRSSKTIKVSKKKGDKQGDGEGVIGDGDPPLACALDQIQKRHHQARGQENVGGADRP
jgi:hypothetical protein